MPVNPNSPDTPGSDTSPYPGLRDDVRTLIQDGMPSYATTPYGLVRQESLTDQIPVGGGLTTFYVRWQNIPLGKNVTVLPVAATIAAYVDGATSPKTLGNGGVTSDIDQNGNFTLATAPTSSLLVTYGWQVFTDGDIDQFLDLARSWLFQWATLDQVPDGMNPALTKYAAHLACSSIARRMALPDVTAGEAKEALSQIAKAYAASAKQFLAEAEQSRKDYWTSADQPLQPAAATVSLRYPAYEPKR
jgi:hypothetical protein